MTTHPTKGRSGLVDSPDDIGLEAEYALDNLLVHHRADILRPHIFNVKLPINLKHVFGLWEGAGVSWENPYGHANSTQAGPSDQPAGVALN